MKLLSVESDAKTIKGSKFGYLTAIQYFRPDYNTCMFASKGCMTACLNTAGRGGMDSVQDSRKNKKELFFQNPDTYVEQLEMEIFSLIRKAKKRKQKPCVRLNGTSDITWEIAIGETLRKFQGIVQFYDYTKNMLKALCYNNNPINYTVSYNEDMSIEEVKNMIKNYINVAVVFRNSIPKTWYKMRVINGDENDLRFLDPKGCIVGLKAKGKAKKDVSGFVVDA